jgi:uncharacterized protein (TIGR03435 family)
MRLPALFLIAAVLYAQTFEVASVKVNNSDSGRSSYPNLTKGKLTAQHTSMRSILQVAWGLRSLQINGPAWIDSDYFDLAGTAPQGVPDTAIQPLLQALLKDRFHLAAHIESREMPVYNLVLLKDGPKCTQVKPDTVFPPAPKRPAGADSAIMGPMTMDGLALRLSATSAAGRPVINKTGLDGRYFCVAFFSNLSTDSSAEGPGDIFAALQQQLGLKLEPAKAPLDVLVVDHIERTPTEN